jgi:hypothetical protein
MKLAQGLGTSSGGICAVSLNFRVKAMVNHVPLPMRPVGGEDCTGPEELPHELCAGATHGLGTAKGKPTGHKQA